MNTRIITYTLICLLSIGLVQAQSTKDISKQFDANASTTLNIWNSFGDVDIESYSGDKIDITVTVSIEPKNSKKDVKEYFDRIKIEFEETGSEIKVKTVNDLNGGWKVKNFDISYKVKIPKTTNLKIKNSFGDVSILGTQGWIDLQVQHGDCFISEGGDANNSIRVDFGDLRIETIGESSVEVKHGDVSFDKIGPLNLKVQFGDCDIEYLEGVSRINLMHGDLDIDDLSSKIESLAIDVQFSDIDISGIDAGDFLIDLEGTFTDFDYPSNWYARKQIKDYNSEEYLLLTKGEGAAGSQSIIIIASHSDVDLE